MFFSIWYLELHLAFHLTHRLQFFRDTHWPCANGGMRELCCFKYLYNYIRSKHMKHVTMWKTFKSFHSSSLDDFCYFLSNIMLRLLRERLDILFVIYLSTFTTQAHMNAVSYSGGTRPRSHAGHGADRKWCKPIWARNTVRKSDWLI